jgi:hypothetical protein
LRSLPLHRHAADGRHPVRQSRLYKGASRDQTQPVGGVAGSYARRLIYYESFYHKEIIYTKNRWAFCGAKISQKRIPCGK